MSRGPTNIDSRSEDVAQASNMIPFNIGMGRKLLNAPLHSTVPTVSLDRKEVANIQGDVAEYVASLDSRLRGLFANGNEALAKRIRETERAPAMLCYFQLQQQMLSLSGDLSTKREKEMLGKLASLIDN